ncbi:MULTISPECIES: WhiB family transcriptional regulator [unclassified Streptomyces]|uniref:WhiB family transcriptional regulator n=1 Tax=unclassified Streptomyces TaxID=2593676 RepID=UPI0021C66001|nr:WhiB family transcriptional regulator [Streptomyces sp. FIT100]UUN30378.1 WhiB family transcriptional regulator [Streptomyces sp. FIT100]
MPINTTTVSATPDEEFSWQENALCAQVGPEFFFPAPGSSTREAKQLCRACEGRVACLEYALANDERFGVWGGMSEKERGRLRRGAHQRRG